MRRHNFKKLKIWEEGMSLVDDTYQLVTLFPNDEKSSLKTQILKCSISIPSNIAEGSSKSSDKHFSHCLEMSLGSAFEWRLKLL